MASQNILDGRGSTSPYWHLSSQSGGITQPTMKATVTTFYDAGTRLYPRPLDVALGSKALLDSFNLFYS